MKQEIIESEEKLLQAFRDSDIKAMDGLIHDDLIFNGPTGELIDKEMDLSTYRSGNMVVEIMEFLEREVCMFGDTATVSTVVYLKGSFQKNPIDGKARFFRTWKNIGGQWQVIGGSSVLLQ